MSSVATAAGAVVFAAAGLLDPATNGNIIVTALAPLVGAALLIVGPVALRSVHRDRLGRLGGWGTWTVVAGLVATTAGSVLNLVAALTTGDTERLAAAAAVPAWILAHLVYVGGTLLGIAAVRTADVPRPIAIALMGNLPLLLVGVPGGLALGTPWSGITTWVATEGQVGLAWLLVAVHLWPASGTARRPASTTHDAVTGDSGT